MSSSFRGSISISTTVYSEKYILIAWKSRHQLTPYERRGFAHFMYLTISAHMEGVIAESIKKRCSSMIYVFSDTPFASIAFTGHDN